MAAAKTKTGTTIPRSGILFLFTVGIILVPAYWLSVNLIFLIAAMFLGIWIYNWLWSRINLWRVSLTPHPLPDLFADRQVRISLEITNRKSWLGAHFLSIEPETIETQLAVVPGTVLKLRGKSSETLRLDILPLERGWTRILGFRLTSGYPFGLVIRSLSVLDETEILVYPRLLDHLPARLRAEHRQRGQIPNSSDDYQYLTAYQPGDDVRRIHWRKSTLLESPVLKKDLIRIEDMEPTLFVPDACSHFEYAVSALTTYFHLRNRSTAWAIFTDDGIQSVENKMDMLRRLALVQPLRRDVDRSRLFGRYRPLFASDLAPEEILL